MGELSMLLAGKAAIVTGAAQGIGRACAERLAKEGASVALGDVNSAGAKAAADAIAAAGGKAISLECDVAKTGEVRACIDAALDAFGRIDVLVNNAGILDDVPFLDLSEQEFDRVLGVNLRGAFLMGQAAARQMMQQAPADRNASRGTIVNMSSVNAQFALPDHVAYSISKGGINQLTKAMAIALPRTASGSTPWGPAPSTRRFWRASSRIAHFAPRCCRARRSAGSAPRQKSPPSSPGWRARKRAMSRAPRSMPMAAACRSTTLSR
jgi:NAD(P)-dependent dehydrogenase (short-subunit alcohol dehydrogenase family)